MKTRTLLMTTMLGTSFALAQASYVNAADTITTNTVAKANTPISSEAVSDPRIAAQNFVAHVNYARVALAMGNADLAKQHISQARNMSTLVTGATTE